MSPAPDPQSHVIGQAMSDPSFRGRLLADPAGTLSGAGVEVPEGVTIEVVEDTATRLHLILPAMLQDGDIVDQDLEAIVGGMAGQQPSACGGVTNNCFLKTG